MKTVALIPVKMSSKRVPGKNIKLFFDGTPLMSFIQRTCLESNLINEVYVYCSDDTVKEYILSGVRFLKRPPFLDADTVNANDIIREFIKSVDADIYVNAHTTSPFAKTKTIDDCISKVSSGVYDSAFCAENIKTFMWSGGKAVNFNPDHFPRTQDLPDIYGETSIAYVFTKESFLKNNRRLGEKPYIKEVGKIEAIDIDYPEDFEIANAVYKEVVCKWVSR
ncbi:MAG: acylneuraminate cytidylyltransferase family protein [Lachnospiraceae bacterium]|nr:acylneuraminate cytidylyltransferase family protein [Lachnospiraceae bacterium]